MGVSTVPKASASVYAAANQLIHYLIAALTALQQKGLALLMSPFGQTGEGRGAPAPAAFFLLRLPSFPAA